MLELLRQSERWSFFFIKYGEMKWISRTKSRKNDSCLSKACRLEMGGRTLERMSREVGLCNKGLVIPTILIKEQDFKVKMKVVLRSYHGLSFSSV